MSTDRRRKQQRPAASDRAPSRRRMLGEFSARFFIAAILLLWPWKGLGPAFVSVIGGLHAPLLNLVVDDPASVLIAPDARHDSWNALVTVRTEGLSQGLALDVRRTPYLPMSILVAFILAVPGLRAERRTVAVALGLVLLQALPGLRLVALFAEPGPLNVVHLPGLLVGFLGVITRVLVLPPGMAFAIPILLALLLIAVLDPRALVRAQFSR
ncbi:MAG: hypothetical protein KA712_10080 [Myxococcales bacterium]|nr:hypothetical protein [Myxococcales bacterium]